MSIFITNVDDYISPSQACVNPLVLNKSKPSQEQSKRSIVLANEDDVVSAPRLDKKPNLINTKMTHTDSKVAAVSLNDCLACSGCITTAESVLIQEQSYDSLLNHLSINSFPTVVALSPQSLASITSFLGNDISMTSVFRGLSVILKNLGVTDVVDMSAVGDVALFEARQEFLERLKSGNRFRLDDPEVTTSLSSTAQIVHHMNETRREDLGPVDRTPQSLPMFVSQCPGWICYAEKSYPQSIPYISTTKSPQQILGTIAREVLMEKGRIESKRDVYIVSVQPCFDKKLESSRKV